MIFGKFIDDSYHSNRIRQRNK